MSPGRSLQRCAASVAGAVSILAACGQPPPAEPDNGWGRSLAASLELPAGRVTCPRGAGSSTLGLRFDCTAIDDAGVSFPVHVSIDFAKHRSDTTSWRLDGVLVDEASAAATHASELGARAAVHCPTRRVFLKRGDSFTCDVAVGGHQQTAVFTRSGDDAALTVAIAGTEPRAPAGTLTAKPTEGPCGCVAGDLMCTMRCAAK